MQNYLKGNCKAAQKLQISKQKIKQNKILANIFDRVLPQCAANSLWKKYAFES